LATYSLVLSEGDIGFTVTKFLLSLLIFNFTILSPLSIKFNFLYVVLSDFLNLTRKGDGSFLAHDELLTETADYLKSGVSLENCYGEAC